MCMSLRCLILGIPLKSYVCRSKNQGFGSWNILGFSSVGQKSDEWLRLTNDSVDLVYASVWTVLLTTLACDRKEKNWYVPVSLNYFVFMPIILFNSSEMISRSKVQLDRENSYQVVSIETLEKRLRLRVERFQRRRDRTCALITLIVIGFGIRTGRVSVRSPATSFLKKRSTINKEGK